MRKAFLGAFLALAASPVLAQPFYTLTDHNSVVQFDQASVGAYSWTVDGNEQLFQQWFWYRINGVDGQEYAIDTLGFTSGGTTDTDFNGFDDTLVLNFAGRGLDVQLRFSLQGGTAGSAASDMAEQIRITNNTGSAANISLFQYSDFDMNGTAGDDTVRFVSPNAFRQSDSTGPSFNETVVTPAPSAYQADLFPFTWLSLNDGALTNLNNNGGPLTGDVTWAFQWNLPIGNGNSVTISKDKNFGLIPAPGAALLGLLGLSCVNWARRRLS